MIIITNVKKMSIKKRVYEFVREKFVKGVAKKIYNLFMSYIDLEDKKL